MWSGTYNKKGKFKSYTHQANLNLLALPNFFLLISIKKVIEIVEFTTKKKCL
jgi:hypothetical protein